MELISEFRDHFCQQLDNAQVNKNIETQPHQKHLITSNCSLVAFSFLFLLSQTGIKATLKQLMTVLRFHDPALWRHIEVVNKVGQGAFYGVS